MENWKETKLGDEIGVLTDYTANGSFESLKQNVQYYNDINFAVLVRTTDLGKPIFKPQRFTDKKGYSFLKTVHLFGGEIVIANVGSIGKTYRVPLHKMAMVLAPNMYLLKFKDSVDENYIYQYLISSRFKDSLLKVIGSTTLQAVNKDNLRSIKLKLPPKLAQTRIAEILSTADAAIANTEALIAKYQHIKTGLMQDLLTKGIDENGNIRNKETHKFVVKNGIEVPVEWEVEQIENYCIHSAFGPRFPGNLYSVTGNIGTLRTTDLDIEGNINYETIPFANLNVKDFESHLLMEDDLLITRSGTVGIVSVFKKQAFHVIPGAFLIRFRLKSSILPEYLRFYFRNEIGKRKLLDIAEGGVQKNIRGSAILKLFVPIPNLIEQKEIYKRLSQIEGVIQDYNNSLLKFNSLKTGLMQDLLSGKVRVK